MDTSSMPRALSKVAEPMPRVAPARQVFGYCLALSIDVILVSSTVLFSSVVFAAEQPFAAPKAAEPVAAAGAGSLAQVTLSLVLVLAAVFAAAWLVRRLRGFGRLGAGAIEIVADVALGTKERAVLVQVGAQQLLLGIAPGSVTTLHVLAEPVSLPRPPSSPPPLAGAGGESNARPDFKAILKRSLGL